MKNKMKRKAMGHLEMILSFTIFVGFVIFLLVVFKPFRIGTGDEAYLDILEQGFNSKIGVEVNFTTIKLLIPVEDCFCFESSLRQVIVRGLGEDLVNAVSSGNKICVDGKEEFYYIYSSNEFIENYFDSDTCKDLTIGEYKLGLFRSFQMTSDKKLSEFKNRYEDAVSYDTLRDELKIPATKEFSVYIRDTEGNILWNATKDAPPGIGVVARDMPVQILSSTGEIKYAILNMQIW